MTLSENTKNLPIPGALFRCHGCKQTFPPRALRWRVLMNGWCCPGCWGLYGSRSMSWIEMPSLDTLVEVSRKPVPAQP